MNHERDELLLCSDISHLYFFDASRDCMTGSGTAPTTSACAAPIAELSSHERTLGDEGPARGDLRSGRTSLRILRFRSISTPAPDLGSPESPHQRWFKRDP